MKEETIVLGSDQGNMLEINETGQIIPVMEVLVIEPLHEDVVLPSYASEGDSGMDVRSRENYVLKPGETKLFKLGFKMQIPRHPFHALGYRWEAQARPRSGLSLKTPLRVANAPGTVDNFYEHEVGIILTNTADPEYVVGSAYKWVADGRTDGTTPVVSTANIHQIVHNGATDLTGEFHSSAALSVSVPDAVAYAYDDFPAGSLLIRKGDRIAQLVLVEVIRPAEIVVGKVGTDSDRGGGFGSTGVK